MAEKIVELICLDIDALSKKILNLLGESPESVLAAGSLASAAYILRGGQSEDISQPVSKVHQAIQGQSDISDTHGIDSIARKVAARLGASPQSPVKNLANEWAGPLPSRNGTSTKSKPSIPVARPDSICPTCEEPCAGHPVEHASGTDSRGRAVVVLCGGTRVRCIPDKP